MNAQQGHRYKFNLPWRGVIVGTAFYAGLSLLTFRLARDFEGVIFAALSAIGAIFAILAVIMLCRRAVFPRKLELSDECILFPHGFPTTRITRIPYQSIIAIKDIRRGEHRWLSLSTGHGNFEIGNAHLDNPEACDVIKAHICKMTGIELARSSEANAPQRFTCDSSKFLFEWEEPESWPRYRTHLVRSTPLFPRLLKAAWFFVRCLAFIYLPWSLLKLTQVPTISAMGLLFLAVPVGAYFTWLHWMNQTQPERVRKVTVLGRGISVLSGMQTAQWSYHDFSGWTIIERQFRGDSLEILLLERPTYILSLVFPDAVTRDRFLQILREKSVPQLPGLKPPWE